MATCQNAPLHKWPCGWPRGWFLCVTPSVELCASYLLVPCASHCPSRRRLRVHFSIPGPPPQLDFYRLPESNHFKDSCSDDFDDSWPPAAPGSFRHPRTASEGLSPI